MVTKRPGVISEDSVVNTVLDVFTLRSGGLKFTRELRDAMQLKFLDLKMKFTDDHVCWLYYPRTKKGLLHYNSAN